MWKRAARIDCQHLGNREHFECFREKRYTYLEAVAWERICVAGMGFPGGSHGLIPVLGRSPGEGNSNPL